MKNPQTKFDYDNYDNEKSESLNLTGSPLKDDYSIENLLSQSIADKILFSKPWHDIEEMYTPVDINKAREIIVNVSNEEALNQDSRGWIFILCSDESEPPSNRTFLLSYYLKQDMNIRGSAKYLGTIKHEDKSMDNLMKRHFSFIASNTRLYTNMESTFQITPDVSLKFMNASSALNPCIDHIDGTSEVVLYQQVEIGKSHILCEDFWIQINLLNKIKQEIVSYKNSSIDGTSPEPNYNYGSADMTYENLQEKVNRILSEVNTAIEGTDATVDTGLEAVIKRTRNRHLSEISDLLWDLLKHTSSYNDLKKIIKFIFHISSRSNIVNLPTSNNRLSELIRELSQQRLAIPHLIGTEPLELLLEIGIEKLMKDFEFILSESKICQLSTMSFGGGKSSQAVNENRLSVRKSLAAAAVDLNQSTRKTLLKASGGSLESNEDEDDGMRNSRFVERDAELNISKLAQVHLAIEHLLLIQNNLSMENDYAAITKKLFAKPRVMFDNLLGMKFDKFEIAINDKKVIHLVENLVPNVQKFVLDTGNKFKDIKSVFYFNIEQIVPCLAEKDEDVVGNSGDTFHFIQYTTISSKF